MRPRRSWPTLLAFTAALHVVVLVRATVQAAPEQAPPAIPATRTGAEIFRATCATCHALDGRGSPRSVVGFDKPLPDFTDCSFATAEADADWQTVVHEGGPIRALDHHMPAFGDALSRADIAHVITYVRSFCTDKNWPQGDLNFPRAFFTEKAFPESETVFTAAATGGANKQVEQAVEYEHRLGSRGQATLEVPLQFAQDGSTWTRGLSDVEIGYKHTLFSSVRSGTIVSASAIVTLPTGKEDKGFGAGVVVYEPVVHFGQRLPRASFIQAQAGLEFPSNTTIEPNSSYVNLAGGKSFAVNHGFGRLFTPQVELLWARESGGDSVWDVVPGIQVSLSKIQHIRAAVGARVPLTGRDERRTQLVMYLLWDWADGGFFEFWEMSAFLARRSRWTLLVGVAVTLWAGAFALTAPQTPAATVPAAKAPANKPHASSPMFAHSENCVACHNNLTAPAGEDVSIGASWRSTMMANSARDPYWHASVRRETVDHATHAPAIQDECATCHMPMEQRAAKSAGRLADLFSLLPMSRAGESDAHALAADGVSCTVCHQISASGLGTDASFNGNFTLGPPRPDGIRDLFGPFLVDPGRRRIMRSVTGFEQVEGAHVKQSELCATCHTLKTQAFGPDGRVVGSLPEQMNYQEWLHSDFPREKQSCQSCHMPAVNGPVRVSSVLGDYRDSLSRHVFVGGNAFMVRLLNRYRTELGVTALPSELEATARATVRQLTNDTATVAIDSVSGIGGGTLGFDVRVTNLSGHKLPTGYPARRTWLHVVVKDARGAVLFESGAIDTEGRIAGNDNDTLATAYEPHYDRITAADQVQIYESILGDSSNAPTTGLLMATQYLKDNRILPRGFDKTTADPDIAVHGAASTDASFIGGSDRVRFDVSVASGSGPAEITVELRYQSIGYRWAMNLGNYDAPEPKLFVGYYKNVSPDSSIVMATARWILNR